MSDELNVVYKREIQVSVFCNWVEGGIIYWDGEQERNRFGSYPKLVRWSDLYFQSMPMRHLRGDAEYELGL